MFMEQDNTHSEIDILRLQTVALSFHNSSSFKMKTVMEKFFFGVSSLCFLFLASNMSLILPFIYFRLESKV